MTDQYPISNVQIQYPRKGDCHKGHKERRKDATARTRQQRHCFIISFWLQRAYVVHRRQLPLPTLESLGLIFESEPLSLS